MQPLAPHQAESDEVDDAMPADSTPELADAVAAEMYTTRDLASTEDIADEDELALAAPDIAASDLELAAFDMAPATDLSDIESSSDILDAFDDERVDSDIIDAAIDHDAQIEPSDDDLESEFALPADTETLLPITDDTDIFIPIAHDIAPLGEPVEFDMSEPAEASTTPLGETDEYLDTTNEAMGDNDHEIGDIAAHTPFDTDELFVTNAAIDQAMLAATPDDETLTDRAHLPLDLDDAFDLDETTTDQAAWTVESIGDPEQPSPQSAGITLHHIAQRFLGQIAYVLAA